MVPLYDYQTFLHTKLPTTIEVINYHKKYFIAASNHLSIILFPTLFKEFRKITRVGKSSYESLMYGSGYFLLPIHILAE